MNNSNIFFGNRFSLTSNALDGRKCFRNKYDHPYSYDCHVIWQKLEYELGHDFFNGDVNCVYSDRLLQQDWNRFNSSSMKVWENEGQTFYSSIRQPNDIEKFLQLYFDNENLELVVIGEGANLSSGYPYWVFGFKNKK